MSELSGRVRSVSPVLQLVVPCALVATRLMTQVLVMGLAVFGIGSGGPNRQPERVGYSGLAEAASVQLRLVPVSVLVAAARPRAPVPGSQVAMLVCEEPMSGTVAGRGTLSWPLPK